MLSSRAMMLLLVTVWVLVVPTAAQSPVQNPDQSKGSIGLSVGILGPRDEFVEGTSAEFGGWADLGGGGKWSVNIDAAVTRRLRGEIEPALDRTIPRGPGTRFNQRWAIGAAGLRRIRMVERREVFHLLLGGGMIFKKRSYVFEDPAFPQMRWSDVESSPEVIFGAGMDVPFGRYIARIQGRFNYGNPMSAYQFRVGVGWGY